MCHPALGKGTPELGTWPSLLSPYCHSHRKYTLHPRPTTAKDSGFPHSWGDTVRVTAEPCNHKSEDWPREPGLPLKDHRNIFRGCPTKIRLKVMVLPWFPRIFLSKREVVPSYKSHLPFLFLEAPCGCTKRGSSGLHQAEWSSLVFSSCLKMLLEGFYFFT